MPVGQSTASPDDTSTLTLTSITATDLDPLSRNEMEEEEAFGLDTLNYDSDVDMPINYMQESTVVAPQLLIHFPQSSIPPLQHSQTTRRALVWFRKDLRLHDNLALQAALHAEPGMAIIPIYIIHRPVKKRCGAVRFQFLLECLHDLARNLNAKNSQLLVLRGDATEVFKVILPAWQITDLFFEELVMNYAVVRDHKVQQIAKHFKVRVATFADRMLFDARAIITANNGQVPTNFDDFVRLTAEMPQPPLPHPTPITISGNYLTKSELFELLDRYCRRRLTFGGDVIAGPKQNPFAIPSLDAFGLTVPPIHSFLYGGETQALRRLLSFCANEEHVNRFQKPNTSPVCVDTTSSTTALSPYISFGCLSVREFFYRVMVIQLKFAGQKGPPAVTLDGQLLWREFFYCYAIGVPHFDTQDKNSLCKQIDWKLQHVPPLDSIWSPATKSAMEELQAWMAGKTGFPWIDAVMRQIDREGWAHHVGRHAVACFLTRGDLYISWLRGAYFFQEKLIDFDWALTIGNWLWQWDPEGAFIRKYVPELRKLPKRYIFEPWKAPIHVQRNGDCLIGKDYPFPIVDHNAAVKKCIEGVERAYSNAPNLREKHSNDLTGFCTCCYFS